MIEKDTTSLIILDFAILLLISIVYCAFVRTVFHDLFVSLLLLFQFENLVWHHHSLVAAATVITRSRNVEERVVQGHNWVITLPVSFSTDGPMVLLMSLGLLLVANGLLAAVTWGLRLARI